MKKKRAVKKPVQALAVIPEKVKPEIQQVEKLEVTDKMIDDYLFGSKTQLTEDQKIMFLQTAKALQLNPFKREIYAIPYAGKMSLITGYEVYLKRAERSGKLSGWNVTVEGQADTLRAVISIHRKDWKEPMKHEVYMSEYKQNYGLWLTKKITMLKKVAIAQGFRLAFPDELGGMPYSPEELPENMAVAKEPEHILAPEAKQIEPPKKAEPIKYTLPKGITPETMCNIGPYKDKPKAYKDIRLDHLLTLWEKVTNPAELEGVISWSVRANIEVKLAGKKYDWEKFNSLETKEKLNEYIALCKAVK